jgi:hypothetical protein
VIDLYNDAIVVTVEGRGGGYTIDHEHNRGLRV